MMPQPCIPGLEEEYEALTQFLYMAPIGLVQTRLDGEILMVNPLCAQLLMPLAPTGDLANLFEALGDLTPDLAHRARSFVPTSGMVCDGMLLHLRGRDSARGEPTVLSLTLMKLDADRLMAVLGDVTQQVRRDRALRHNQAWIQTLVSGLTDYALLSLDARGHVRCWNPSVQRVTGHTAGTAVGQPYAIFYPPDSQSAERLHERLEEADRHGWSLEEGWRQRADGSRFWGSCLVAPLHAPEETEPEGRAYSLIVRDVSDQREATEALRRSVLTDHLTGVDNRRAFFDAAESELQRWQRTPRALTLVLFDADHFKRINDQHGHASGDAVLRHLASALRAAFREVDVVARLGGEEFVVLLPGANADAAEGLARRVCRDVAAHSVQVENVEIRYTLSAGVAAMDAGIDSVDVLIKRADAAMYAAKHGGRNRVVRWHPGLRSGLPAAEQA